MVPEWTCPACRRAEPGPTTPGATCPDDGRVLVPATTLAEADAAVDPVLGRVIGGQYAVFDRLGRGGMGAVYRAVHRRLGRQVALKTILPDRVDEDGAELRARFELEARLLSEMRHPGIVTVYDFGEERGVLYMVLELVGGHSLADALRGTPRLPVPRAADIIGQLLAALAEPHGRGLIHRDIKPSNIMLEPRADGGERVVLIDFGVAKDRTGLAPDGPGGPRTRTGVAVGTPRYMAPEQLAGGELGPWTDHYAAAVVLYRMLAGHSPFIGPPAEMIAAHLRDPVPPLPAELGIGAFDAVLARAMAKKPAARFADGAAFAEAVTEAVQGAVKAAAAAASERATGGAPTAPMPAVRIETRATSHEPTMVHEPTPSDFSSAWRGAVDHSGTAEVAAAARSRARWRWLGLAALVGLGMSVGLLVVTQMAPGRGGEATAEQASAPEDTAAAERVVLAAAPVAERGATAAPVAAAAAETGAPAAAAPAATTAAAAADATAATDAAARPAPAAATAKPDAAAKPAAAATPTTTAKPAPPAATPTAAATPAATAKPATPTAAATAKPAAATVAPTAKPAAAATAAARRTPSVDELTRLARRQLAACRCADARQTIDRLARLDRPAARALDGDHTLECGLVGMGCLSQGGAGAP